MFPPYHNLENCIRVRSAVRRIELAALAPPDQVAAHNRYHYSLTHKLRSATHYADRLSSHLSAAAQHDAVGQSDAVLFEANRLIDGFFYTAGSGLDILAREVLSYFAIPLPPIVYFGTARTLLAQHRPNDALIARLDDPQWKDEFSNYRNALTHELLLAGAYTIEVRVVGASQSQKVVMPLPDDPRVARDQWTYQHNPDATIYAARTLRRLMSLVNQVYGDLAARMNNVGRLPL